MLTTNGFDQTALPTCGIIRLKKPQAFSNAWYEREGWNLLIISTLEIFKFSYLYFGIYLNSDMGNVQHGSHNPFEYYHTEKTGEKKIHKIITLKRKWVVWSPCIELALQ